jgi:phage terminase large subunit
MDLEYTNVFARNRAALDDPTVRFVLNQGGSRSSKTFSISQLLLVYCLTNRDKVVSVVRKTMPSLRASVMRDFFEIMNSLGVYDRQRHNKTDNTYTFHTGTLLEFFSVDEEQKVRGRKRDVCWVDESNDLWNEDFVQLNLRTADKMFFSYNPSDLSGYLYDLAERSNAVVIKSTYRDNPFLAQSQIDELEFLRHTDPDMYRIYNLGERATTSEHVLRHWSPSLPATGLPNVVYGLDFGWQHPTALVRLRYDDSGRIFHAEQVVHEKFLTNDELVARMRRANVGDAIVVCDSARPDIIAHLNENGVNAVSADKAVKKGLDILKSSVLTVDPQSRELIKDLENYRYKKLKGKPVDEVMKIYDDGVDAMRYAAVYARQTSGGLQFATIEW